MASATRRRIAASVVALAIVIWMYRAFHGRDDAIGEPQDAVEEIEKRMIPVSVSPHLSFVRYVRETNQVEIPDIAMVEGMEEFYDMARTGKKFGFNVAIQQFEIDPGLDGLDTPFEVVVPDRIRREIDKRIGSSKERKCNLWITPNGTKAELHFDKYDGFLYQIRGGHRRVRLVNDDMVIPSAEAEAIEVKFNLQSKTFVKQEWNGETFIENFATNAQDPEIASRGTVTILSDGEFIIIPSGTYHEIISVAHSGNEHGMLVAVNCWRYPP